jgi:hypothetical protein
MPRKSNKRSEEETLREIWEFRMIMKTMRLASGQESLIEDTTDQAYFLLYHDAYQKRYINRPGQYRTQLSTQSFHLDLQDSDDELDIRAFLTPTEFLQKYRMSRVAFYKLVSLIENHPIFGAGARGPQQASPAHQLMVFLKYIGTEGSGNSNPDLRSVFRTGRGTNEVFKNRVVKAIRSMRSTYYSWPDEEERRQISSRIHRAFDFPNCVGFIDGTLNPLSSKPRREDSGDFYGRKQGYSLSTLTVSDDRRMIRYFLAGWPGSCHDNRVYRNCMLASTPNDYFSGNQYLLGDSAYEPSDNMVPSYKKPNGCNLPREHVIFNACLASARVTSEHCIGVWKARFPWLRNIPMILTESQRSLRRILHVMECTVILHNFLIMGNEAEVPNDWLDDNDVTPLDPNDEVNREIRDGDAKDKRRAIVMQYVNENRH